VAELCKLVKQKIQSETVRQRNLAATADELQEMTHFLEKSMAADRVRRREDLARFESELANGRLSAREHDRIMKRVDTLRRLAENDEQLETMPKLTPDMMRMINAPWVEAWKYHQAIYAEFGGTVASTKFGPDPVGAKVAMAENLEREGALRIYLPALREAFWKSMREAPRFVMEAWEVDFTPFWKMPLPQNEEQALPPPEEKAMLFSQSDVMKVVEKFASHMNVPIATRAAKVSEVDGLFIVTYEPPPNARGGQWIFRVDKASGEVKDVKIYR
jgi:hypothetical protein